MSETYGIPMITHRLTGTIEVYALGDMHVGAREADLNLVRSVVNEILSKPNRYCVITGDVVDNGIKSSVTSPYDAVYQPYAGYFYDLRRI